MALAFGLLGWVIWRNRDQIREVFSRAARLPAARRWRLRSTWWGWCSTFVRWFFLVRVIEPTFQLRAALLLGFIGNVFNLVIPGAVGGDLIKAAYLVRMQIKKTQAIASMVIDRILGLLGLFILAAVAGGLAWPVGERECAPADHGRLGRRGPGLPRPGGDLHARACHGRFPGLLVGHGQLRDDPPRAEA